MCPPLGMDGLERGCTDGRWRGWHRILSPKKAAAASRSASSAVPTMEARHLCGGLPLNQPPPRLSPPPPSAPPLENCYRQTTIRQAPRNTCKTICEQRHRLARSVAASFAPLCLRPFPEEDSFVFRGACSNNSNMKVNCCSPG